MYKRIAIILVFIMLLQVSMVNAAANNQSQGNINPLAEEKIKQGTTLANQGKLEDALICFDEAIKIDSKDFYPYYLKALVLMDLSRKDDAIQALGKSIEMDNNSVRPIGVIEFANANPRFDAIRDSIVFKRNNTVGNTVGNINNFGFAAEQNGWIYYYNRENGGITRVNSKDTKIRIKEGNAWYINVVGGWVYYSEIAGALKKIRADGSEIVTLDEDGASGVCVVNDLIYYVGGGYGKECIYKMKTDGSSKTVICKDYARNLNIIGNTIYYANQNDKYKVYKVGIDGTGRTKLNEDSTNCLTVIDNRIYYVNTKDYCVYSTDLNGKNRVRINSIKTLFMNINNGWIYFTNFNDNGRLYKIKTDGTGLTKLNNSDSGQFSVVGDWIYYSNSDDKDSNFYRVKKDGTGESLVN